MVKKKQSPEEAEDFTVATVKASQVVAQTGVDDGYGDNLDNDDLMLPRVELLQAMSPYVEEEMGPCKPGEFVNSITKDELVSPVKFIPVYLSKNWIRWKPRSEGGGMLWKCSDPKDPLVIEESKWEGDLPPLATAYLNYLCLVEGQDMPMILSFHDTSYQEGRRLFTMAKMVPGPIYSSRYTLESMKKENSKGKFFVLKVKKAGPSSAEDIAKARDVSSMFAGKELNFSPEKGNQASTDGGSDEF